MLLHCFVADMMTLYDFRCYKCGRYGNHTAAKCKVNIPAEKSCYGCHGTDHLIATCPTRKHKGGGAANGAASDGEAVKVKTENGVVEQEDAKDGGTRKEVQNKEDTNRGNEESKIAVKEEVLEKDDHNTAVSENSDRIVDSSAPKSA